MAFWDWLTGRSQGVEVAADVIWLNQAAKQRGLLQETQERLAASRLVLGLAHFPATLAQLIAELENGGVPHEVIQARLTVAELLRRADQGRDPRLLLALAEVLVPEDFPEPIDLAAEPLAILVSERHLLRTHDDEIEDFARHLGRRCRLQFHLSLDEPLLRLFSGDWIQDVLSGLGMSETEPITSGMIARRVRKAQERLAQRVGDDHKADSADEWLRRNGTDLSSPGP